MLRNSPNKPLGQVLQEADLVSALQVETALKEQSKLRHVRLGEILARKGWLKQETADFFAEQWQTLLSQTDKQPLGQYLKQASLLSDREVETILSEQKQTKLRFGEIVVAKGWLKPKTIDFFLNYTKKSDRDRVADNVEEESLPEPVRTLRKRILENRNCDPLQLLKSYRQVLRQKSIPADFSSEQVELIALGLVTRHDGRLTLAEPSYDGLNLAWVEEEIARLQPFNQIRVKLFKLEEKAALPYSVLEEILWWTGEQFYLTQKLCQLLADTGSFIDRGEEAMQVKSIVENYLIANWETQPAAEPLQAMQQQLLNNQHCQPFRLLKLYRNILLQGGNDLGDSEEQSELLNLGLLARQDNRLKISNPIYERVFDRNWVETKLIILHPWSESLSLFNLASKAASPYDVLEAILWWTGEQFPLTQQLCQKIYNLPDYIAPGHEAVRVRQIVEDEIVADWETQSAEVPLQVVQQKLLKNSRFHPERLLKLYRQILQGENIPNVNTAERSELLDMGLVVAQQDSLTVANPIYERVFDLKWVEKQLIALHPLNERLSLVNLGEKADSPYNVLEEVLWWTGEQFPLTQQLCQKIYDSPEFIAVTEEASRVRQIVKQDIIANWQTQPDGEPLRELQQQILYNQHCQPSQLLRLYGKILKQEEIDATGNAELAELIRLGLVVKRGKQVKVANRIYQAVFNRDWIERELEVRSDIPTADEPIVIEEIIPERAKKRSYFPNKFITLLLLALGIAGAGIVGIKFYQYRTARGLFLEGNALLNQGSYPEALATYDRLLKMDSNYYQAWTNRGYALANLKEYEKMLESCSSATIIQPQDVYAWNCQGEALLNLKEPQRALSAFEKAILLDDRDPIFRINKTEALLALQQSDAALVAIEETIQLIKTTQSDRSQIEVARELAIALNSQGKVFLRQQNYQAALNAYEQALAYDPQYFAAQQGRGITLRKLKRYDAAIAQFDQLVRNNRLIGEKKAEAWYYLGITLGDSLKTQEAIVAFNEALKIKPDYQAAKEAKEKLGG
jgi:tetratricopeptide (TPR) repeat protein